MAKRIGIGILAILVILVVYFIVRQAPIDPAPYTPPEKPELADVLAPNDLFSIPFLFSKPFCPNYLVHFGPSLCPIVWCWLQTRMGISSGACMIQGENT